MENETIQIEIYNKREKTSEFVSVEKLDDKSFRVTENAVLNCRLTLGTEFEARINQDSKFEIIRITQASDFLTRRFFLNRQFTEQDYRVLGDEIMKQGGFWQIDFGSIATINLPQNSTLDLDEVFRIFNFHPTEIVED